MPVHIDEMTSEVTAEAEPATQTNGESTTWQEVERLRETHARIVCDQWRTAAEGYDD